MDLAAYPGIRRHTSLLAPGPGFFGFDLGEIVLHRVGDGAGAFAPSRRAFAIFRKVGRAPDAQASELFEFRERNSEQCGPFSGVRLLQLFSNERRKVERDCSGRGRIKQLILLGS
jgi:hypothetical protein